LLPVLGESSRAIFGLVGLALHLAVLDLAVLDAIFVCVVAAAALLLLFCLGITT
jgi:hypothetical protein